MALREVRALLQQAREVEVTPTSEFPSFDEAGSVPDAGAEMSERWCMRHAEVHECWLCHDGGYVVSNLPPMVANQPWTVRAKLCTVCTSASAEVIAAANMGRTANPHGSSYGQFIPAHYQGATLANWRTNWNAAQRGVAFAYTVNWPPSPPILFLTGDKGGGKTFMACVCGNEITRLHGKGVGFYPVIDLLDRYRATMHDEAAETPEEIDAEMRTCALVILDDFGAHNPTAYATERLTRFVDECYRGNRPLIVTTNLPPSALDERVVSRLCDVRQSRVVEFKGDRRKQI